MKKVTKPNIAAMYAAMEGGGIFVTSSRNDAVTAVARDGGEKSNEDCY